MAERQVRALANSGFASNSNLLGPRDRKAVVRPVIALVSANELRLIEGPRQILSPASPYRSE